MKLFFGDIFTQSLRNFHEIKVGLDKKAALYFRLKVQWWFLSKENYAFIKFNSTHLAWAILILW